MSVCVSACMSLSVIVHFSSSWPPERGRVLPGARCVLLQLVVPTAHTIQPLGPALSDSVSIQLYFDKILAAALPVHAAIGS